MKINRFKYENICKGRETVVLVVKPVLSFAILNPFSDRQKNLNLIPANFRLVCQERNFNCEIVIVLQFFKIAKFSPGEFF